MMKPIKLFGLKQLLILNYSLLILSSCGITKQLNRSAKENVLSDSSLLTAHVGISIYEPATSKYWYNYNGKKYFVPASNTKIPTCYAAMKYLGDSLVGLRYLPPANNNNMFLLQPTGDPTFLHPDYKNQRVYNFLNVQKANLFYQPLPASTGWGNGWSWNDYTENYMAERSAMPIYGNVVRFRKTLPFNSDVDSVPHFTIEITPKYFNDKKVIGNLNWKKASAFSVDRAIAENSFWISSSGRDTSVEVPFTGSGLILPKLLEDTLHRTVIYLGASSKKFEQTIHSQPTDSLLKPMMHRSDNFFAEQTLLMVSNEKLGVMNDAKIIDTLLKTDFKDLPQKPRWVDGSGLSRYNLFTPQDFVAILGKMKNDFGMDRIKEILPTGGEGTISSYYKADSGYIYAKTGTLSGVVALSGFLTTKKGKQLIFSVLVNNHNNSATAVRKAVEKFLHGVRNQY